MEIYGRRVDGMMTVCRAKPEHRGQGRCKHVDHTPMDAITAQKVNAQLFEEKYHQEYKVLPALARPNRAAESKKKMKNIPTHQNFEKGRQAAYEKLKNKDFTYIENFIEEYENILQKFPITDVRLTSSVIENRRKEMYAFLKSDNDSAILVRERLGNTDLRMMATLFVKPTSAMVSSVGFRKRGRSITFARYVMSHINNNMNDKNYLRSVLYFNGRCCYCNQSFTKTRKPTGEHFTCISPLDSNAKRGSTTFGNMALACNVCNVAKQSQEYSEWLKTTKTVKRDFKGYAAGRIDAFREYAGYSDYSFQQNQVINRAIQNMGKFSQYVSSLYKNDDEFNNDGMNAIKEHSAMILEVLKKDIHRH